ncbi:NitT/TauT family transport system ATP-binding protein/nitrate/nitrite transport system ATP-binding protein [Georgenia soli]|uniref:NitT/TauT family transport system ATP-binding protein/nitrate/nitrite transport system ATP-binding protein n=1 Tax=Georgenia soli TaxID=638953 RepID=A0A2A9EL33_9MICO|nr:ABC transporter ATP-binding protein [Georgenia soli]PFG38965.1 NitT/TauT family transport system ATP-binding protein/nitrate/nitrite transport system ATP-binding protein [Georgenia soli]
MTYSLEVEDVNVRFRDHVIIDGLTLRVENDEFVSIVGTSGCGKTTLLRTIGGLLPQAQVGRMTLHGTELRTPEPRATMVFQHFGLFPWKTVEQNIRYGLDVQGRSNGMDARVEQLLDVMSLTAARDKYPYQLSGGMKQRVGIARALCLEPELLLLDEPLSAVDAITREIMQREVLGIIERETRTALLVTHDLDEAIIMSDRIIVLGGPPARVVLDVRSPMPRPRDIDSVRSHPDYIPLRSQLWDSLQSGRVAA